jgi:two-component sensor histidine kinase
MALAVNELATNAVKYGALSTIDGTVNISWTCEPQDGKRKFRFVWVEANGPRVTAPTRSGFGSRLISCILAEDFGGTVALSHDPSGVVCTLEALL